MGSAASTIEATYSTHNLQKHEIDPALLGLFDFDSQCDSSGFISVAKLLNMLKSKTDLFLTHDWGIDKSNHEFVSKVNAALKDKGFTTW